MRHLIIMLLAAAGLTGCEDKDDESQEQWQQAYELWQSMDTGEYYFELDIGCFCHPDDTDFSFTVNQQQTVIYNNNRKKYVDESSNTAPQIQSIEQLFEIAQQAISEAASYDIEFDPNYGYPVRIDIDWQTDIADDEFSYRVDNVQLASNIACTEIYQSGLVFNLSDTTTTDDCAATVLVTDGDFSEELNFDGEACTSSLHGAYERPGIYDVTVSTNKHQSQNLEDIHLMADLCHVQTQTFDIELLPIPNPLSPERQQLLSELNTARTLWQNLNVQHHNFDLDRWCECLDDYTQFSIFSYPSQDLTFNRRLEVYDQALYFDDIVINGIDDLFELVELYIPTAHLVAVSYHEQYGYPTSISIDVDEYIADEEISFSISNVDFETELLACTTVAIPGISVSVASANNSAEDLTCQATVIATEQLFSETADALDNCVAGEGHVIDLVFERAGTYQVEIAVDGYQTQVLDNVTVHRGYCHVATEALQVELQPQS